MQERRLSIPLFLGIIAFAVKRIFNYLINSRPQPTRREYEFLCAEWMKKHGYTQVRVTQGSQDNGRDVEGWKDKQLRLGQCKMYGGKKKVGVKDVRELYGVAQAKRARAIFFTTNGYTKAAGQFANQSRISLKSI